MLDVTPEGERPFEAWVDWATHLLARTDEQRTEDRVVYHHADYRPVQGVMLPLTIVVGDDPSFDQVKTVSWVEVNPAIPDATFGMPARPSSNVAVAPGRDAIELPFRLSVDYCILEPLTNNSCLTVEAEVDRGGGHIASGNVVFASGASERGAEGRH